MDYSKSIELMRDRTMELLFDFTDNKNISNYLRDLDRELKRLSSALEREPKIGWVDIDTMMWDMMEEDKNLTRISVDFKLRKENSYLEMNKRNIKINLVE
jgi:hypothetical protein|tara:strand:- start:1554 stop:1853 length:300 start_codon:yes stop_codon:yes gene_type:complete